MRKLFIFVIACCCCAVGKSQNFDFNTNCNKAYSNIIALKIDSGNYYLGLEETNNPNNYIPILLKNYIDFLDIYTSNTAAVYKNRKADFETRLKLLRQGDETSPYYLYSQAEVHLHAAVLHIKFGEYFAALLDVKKALNKLQDNQTLYPEFTPNYKSLGTLNTILGSTPEQYQSGLSLFGLKGDVTYGMQLLESSMKDEHSIFQHESATIYAFLQLHISNNSEEAWKVLQDYDFFDSENLMDAYTIGHIGIYGNHNDQGIEALLNRPISNEYAPFPYLDFLLGIGKTYRLDKDANYYLQRFLNENEGEDYVKSAWHKMAWNELINGNESGYTEYLSEVKNSGRSVMETDKQAEKELTANEPPNVILLKARLLTDGNYLKQAKDILESHVVNEFKERHVKTEYFYRLARVYHKLSLNMKAKQFYGLTINNGQNVPFYFAANSAYQTAYILEAEKKWTEAKEYYELAISLDGYEYDNSIDQKAKAGINRIKYNQ